MSTAERAIKLKICEDIYCLTLEEAEEIRAQLEAALGSQETEPSLPLNPCKEIFPWWEYALYKPYPNPCTPCTPPYTIDVTWIGSSDGFSG